MTRCAGSPQLDFSATQTPDPDRRGERVLGDMQPHVGGKPCVAATGSSGVSPKRHYQDDQKL